MLFVFLSLTIIACEKPIEGKARPMCILFFPWAPRWCYFGHLGCETLSFILLKLFLPVFSFPVTALEASRLKLGFGMKTEAEGCVSRANRVYHGSGHGLMLMGLM